MRKTFWLVLAAVLVTISLAVGTTLALFTDSNYGAQSITSGTLCLTSDRDDGEPVPGPMFYVTTDQGQTPDGRLGTLPTGVWAPGDEVIRTLIVNNPKTCSTQDAWLDYATATLASPDSTLADTLQVEITTSKPGVLGDFVVAKTSLRSFLNGPVPLRYADGTRVSMALTSVRFLHFSVTFDKSASYMYQGKSLVVDFQVGGVQKKNNP